MNIQNYLQTLPKNLIFVIAGPTASGKSQWVCNQLANGNGAIINADSMQLYSGLPLLTAQPSPQDMQCVPHYLYSVRGPQEEEMSAAAWVDLAIHHIKNLLDQSKKPWIVGGSGFYLKALMYGLSPIPPIPASLKKKWYLQWICKDLASLKTELSLCDSSISPRLKDKQRIMRALMVYHVTGTPLSVWQKQPRQPPQMYTFYRILIWPSLVTLKRRVALRFDRMWQEGLLSEVASFLRNNKDKTTPLFKAIGLKEIQAFLNHDISKETCKSLYVQSIMRYVKRQRTWFAHQFDPHLIIPRAG